MKIIDCDRHVIEPLEMWQEYTEKKIFTETPVSLHFDNASKQLKRMEKLNIDIALPPTYTLGDFSILSNWDEHQQIASALSKNNNNNERQSATNPVGQLSSMDKTNINQAYIFPTFAGYITNHKEIDAKTSLAYTQAYNRWLSDYCEYAPERLKGVGLVSRHDPGNLTSQIEDIVKCGWTAITIRPEPILGKTLGDPSYEPFWQACEYHNIVIAFHGGTHLQGSTIGMDRFTSRFTLHACSHPMEAQMAFITLLESGVFERYPKLRFAFLEAGCSWVPHWLWRLDNICYNEFPSLIKETIKMLPSEYFKRHCWVAIEPGEPNLRETINWIGHKKLLFGSDFPHPDHAHIDVNNISHECPTLTEIELKDMLENNPQDLFERPVEQMLP